MSDWLNRITAQADDLEPVAEALEHFERLYENWREEVSEDKVRGRRLIDIAARISGITDYCYEQWAIVQAIVAVLENRVLAAVQKSRKFYTEGYSRALGTTQIEHYAKADPEVIALNELVIRFGLIKDRWEGLSKAIERLERNVRFIGEVRKAGLDDIVF